MQSGIYLIVNIQNHKIYIGSAKNFRKRWYVHKCLFRKNKHYNKKLQSVWNKYGENIFEFKELQWVKIEELKSIEQEWIDWLKPEYNLAPNATNSLGYKHTKEAKEKMRNNNLGNKHSKETKLKMSKTHKGKKKSEQHRLNIKRALANNLIARSLKIRESRQLKLVGYPIIIEE